MSTFSHNSADYLVAYTDKRGFTVVRCPDAMDVASEDVHRNGDVYVSCSLIAYDYKNATVVYFTSADDGDEYGQFASKEEAVAQADKAAALRKQYGAQAVTWVDNYELAVEINGELVTNPTVAEEVENPVEFEFSDETGNLYLAMRVTGDLYSVTLNGTYVLRLSATLAEVQTLRDLLGG